MLFCDLMAALSTIVVMILIKTDSLVPWHLYLINAFNGLMNTIQQPAGEVTATLLIPKEHYQKTSGLRSMSNSLNSILTPIFATALFAFAGMEGVIAVDLVTFAIAFLTLLILIPKQTLENRTEESLIQSAAVGLRWLSEHWLILLLILFLAGINLVASACEAALPAMVLSKPAGGETVPGMINTCVGIATLCVSLLTTLLPAAKNRVRVIWLTLFFL